MGIFDIDLINVSDYIFNGLQDTPQTGYLAICGNQIIKVGYDENYQDLAEANTRIINAKEKLVTAGFTDVHTFFTGYAIFHIGAQGDG